MLAEQIHRQFESACPQAILWVNPLRFKSYYCLSLLLPRLLLRFNQKSFHQSTFAISTHWAWGPAIGKIPKYRWDRQPLICIWMPITSHINCNSSQFYSHLESNRANSLQQFKSGKVGTHQANLQSCEVNLQLQAAVQKRELFLLLWVFLRREVKRKRLCKFTEGEPAIHHCNLHTVDKWEKIPNFYWVLLAIERRS